MRNVLKYTLPFLGSLLAAANVLAADVRMSLDKPVIGLLDRALLKIEFIDTTGEAVEIPPVEGLKINYLRKSTETRIVNMRSTSKVVHTYVVTPSKAGRYTIGPVTCRYKGGEKEVSAELQVVKPKDDREVQEISQILFSHIVTDRSSPFVHEPFNLQLKVYIRDDVQIDGSFSLRGGIPESGMDGDLKWEVTDQQREVRDGTIFEVYTLEATARTLTAGLFSFSPEVQVNVVVPRQNRRPYGLEDPFFGDLFGRQETRAIVLDCNTLEVDVRPVPTDHRPQSFSGGVGRFDFDVEVGPQQVNAGEPVTVRMRIRGEGNLHQITPPKIKADQGLKLYAARALPTENENEVLFEQVVIPSTETVTNIPMIAFSYFNTKTADFRTIERGPFPIQVAPRPQQAAQLIATVPGTVLQTTEVLGRDIIYLKPMPSRWIVAGETRWYALRRFLLLLPLPALALAAAAAVRFRRGRLSANVALSRRQQAPKAARRRIQRAEQALRENRIDDFYEALWGALADYFGHRLNLAPGEVTLAAILGRLPGDTEAIETLFSTIEQRRYGRASQADGTPEMKALLRQLSDTLRTCERMKL